MDDDHRGWLERVLQAAERSANQLRERDDPLQRALTDDLEELRDRLRAELDTARG